MQQMPYCMVPENNYTPYGRSYLEIPRGEGVNFLKSEKYAWSYLNWNFLGGEGIQNKNLLWGEHFTSRVPLPILLPVFPHRD